MRANGRLPRPSARSAPKPPKERRERRRALEAALLRGEGMDVILASLGPQFDVSPRTLRSDRRRIEARWAAEDGGALAGMRASALRRLERLATAAEVSGDLRVAVQAATAHARALGLGTPQAVAVAQAGAPMTAIDLVARLAAEAVGNEGDD